MSLRDARGFRQPRRFYVSATGIRRVPQKVHKFIEAVKTLIGPDGTLSEEAKIAAIARSFVSVDLMQDDELGRPLPRKRAVALKRFNHLMARPDVKAALREVYADQAKFSIDEALKLHVKHMRGGFRVETRDRDGNVTGTIKTAPNWNALSKFLDMALPEEPKISRNFNVNANVDVLRDRTESEIPETTARVIGEPVVVERQPFDVEDELEEEEDDDAGDDADDET